MRYAIKDLHDDELWVARITDRKEAIKYLNRVRTANPGYEFKLVRLMTKADKRIENLRALVSAMAVHLTPDLARYVERVLKEDARP
jgi:hypothetical protein